MNDISPIKNLNKYRPSSAEKIKEESGEDSYEENIN